MQHEFLDCRKKGFVKHGENCMFGYLQLWHVNAFRSPKNQRVSMPNMSYDRLDTTSESLANSIQHLSLQKEGMLSRYDMRNLLQEKLNFPIAYFNPPFIHTNQFPTHFQPICYPVFASVAIFFVLWLAKLPPWTFVATDVMSGTKAHAEASIGPPPSWWKNWRKNVSKTGRLRRPQNLSLYQKTIPLLGIC